MALPPHHRAPVQRISGRNRLDGGQVLTPVALDRLWERVRLHLLLLANGATTSFEQKVSTGEKDHYGPTFRHQELAEFEQAWASVRSLRDRERVLRDALEMVFYLSPPAAKHAALPYMPADRRDQLRKLTIGQMRGTAEWREAIAQDSRPAAEVALAYDIRKATVLEYRGEFNTSLPHGGARNGAGRPAKNQGSLS